MYRYKTKGTCSKAIEIEIENGIIKNVRFTDGCQGNLSGLSKLVQGMKADDVIEKLKGTSCGANPTSCPDQLATALIQMKAEGIA